MEVGELGIRTHAAGLSPEWESWGWGWGTGWGESSRCPELGDRKGFRAKQEKTKFPFWWFLGLVPAVGEEAGWGDGFLSPNLQFGAPCSPDSASLLGMIPCPQTVSPHSHICCSLGASWRLTGWTRRAGAPNEKGQALRPGKWVKPSRGPGEGCLPAGGIALILPRPQSWCLGSQRKSPHPCLPST